MSDASEGESTWVRLTRRRVVQWGLAYAAGAWGLLQGLQFLSEVFAWPPSVVRLATVTLASGLPIALVLAWFHGDRGHQRLGGLEASILAVLLLLGGGATWWFGRPSSVGLAVPSPAAERQDALAEKSIAVLPFANRSGDPEQEFFAEGLADTLIQQLSQVGEIKVIARSSSFRYKGRNLDLREVGRELGVGAILDGSVQRSGNRVRVNAQLVNARDGSNFWSKSFDRNADDIFGIQDEIAGEVFSALKLILLSSAMDRQVVSPYRNLDAYEAYLKGRAELERRTGPSLQQAAAAFARATELDPDYALAYVGLANTVLFLAQRELITDEAAQTRASAAVERALALDPNLGEAYAALAPLQIRQGDQQRAEQSYRKAIELSPGYAPAYHWYSGLLQSQGRFADAETMARKALVLDPMSPISHIRLAAILKGLGRYEDAYRHDLASIAIDPDSGYGYGGASVFHERAGRPDEAVRWLRKAAEVDPDNQGPQYAIHAVLAQLGPEELARRNLSVAAERYPQAAWPQMGLARLDFRKGDCPAASRHAERALRNDASDAYAISVIVECMLAGNRVDAALEFVRRAAPGLLSDPRDWSQVSSGAAGVTVARVLMRTGDTAAARALLGESIASLRDEARGDDPAPAWWLVIAYATLGDRKATLNELKRMVDEDRFWGWPLLLESDALEELRADPEFRRQIARLQQKQDQVRASLERRPGLSEADIQAEIKKHSSG